MNGDPNKVFTCEVVSFFVSLASLKKLHFRRSPYHTRFSFSFQPAGGVKEGQVFLAPLPATYNSSRLLAPTGRWKDSIYDCFSTGLFHPSLWMSLCCTQIAMAQVMTRQGLTWLGEPGKLFTTQKAFLVVVALVVCYFIFSGALILASTPYDEPPQSITIIRFCGIVLFSFWSIYSLCKTRENIRKRYSINEVYCKGCEDLCCSMFCSCCATAQLLRHTGEYETYSGSCCTRSGHPAGTPLSF